MKKNLSHTPAALFSFAALLLAIVLEALPHGVTMRFAKGPGEYYLETQSYFSLLPMGYGDILPLLIAALTVASGLALGIRLLTGGKGQKMALVVGFAGAILSIFRLFLFRGYENGVMWAVTVLLTLSWGLHLRDSRPVPEQP